MAGLTPAVTSPFGNSGTSLPPEPGATPVPSAVTLPDMNAVKAAQGIPAEPAAAAAPASVDDFFAQLDAETAPADPNAAVPIDGEMSPMPAPEGFASAKEQLKESLARIKNSFAVTGPESVAALKSFPNLFEDVRYTGDKVQVKRPGRKGWEDFDRDKVEMLGDVLDFARDALETGVEAAGEVAGTAAAVAAGTPLGPGAIPIGVGANMASGAASALAAKSMGDAVAQGLMGIPRDPERNMITEGALTTVLGAGFGWMGSSMARRSAMRAAEKVEMKKTVEYATKMAQEATDDIAQISASGIKLGKDGKFFLDPQMMVGAGNIPELDITAKELSTEAGFRNFRNGIRDSITEAYDGAAKTIGAKAGRGADLGDDFILTAKDIRAAEGKLIGSFRDRADKALAMKPQVSPRLYQTVQLMEQQLKTPGHIERQLGLTPAQAKNFAHEMKAIGSLMRRTKGSIRLDTALAVQERLQKSIDKHINSGAGRPYGMALLDLRNAVRDDAVDMMGNVLPEREMAEFAASKERYKTIMDSTAQLGKLLDTENISKNELVGKLFEGKGSYKFAKSAKTLINETHPELWDNLAGEYFTKLRNDATSGKDVNWGQMAKKWKNLDPRLQKELLDTAEIPPAAMTSLMQIGERVQNATFPFKAKDSNLTMVKRAVKIVANLRGGGAAQGTAVTSMLEGMGKDQALAKWLKDGGMEEILKEMPGMEAGRKAQFMAWVNGWTPRTTAKPIKSTLDAQARQYLLRDEK